MPASDFMSVYDSSIIYHFPLFVNRILQRMYKHMKKRTVFRNRPFGYAVYGESSLDGKQVQGTAMGRSTRAALLSARFFLFAATATAITAVSAAVTVTVTPVTGGTQKNQEHHRGHNQ